MGSKKLANNNGSQDALLKSIKATQPSIQIQKLSDKEKQLVEQILQNIFNSYETLEEYERTITSKNTDAILGRIASLLDEVKDDFTNNELTEVKNYIVDSLNETIKNKSTLELSDNDIETIKIQITNSIATILSDKLNNIVQTLTDFFNDKFNTLETNQNNIDSNLDEINTKNSDITETLSDENISEKTQTEKSDKTSEDNIEKEKTSEKNTEDTEASDNDSQKTDILSTINSFLSQIYDKLDNILLNIEEIQNNVLKNFSNTNNFLSKLIPSKKEEKQLKVEKQEQKESIAIIKQIKKTLDSVLDFCNNFIDFWVANFKTFLNKVFKVLTAFILKILATIVFPAMAILALGLTLIAEPIAKMLKPIQELLQPISEGIGEILKSFAGALRLLEKLGEFVLDKLQVVWDKVMVPLLDGIGVHAKAIGEALGILALSVVNVLANLMKGLSTKAYDIGVGLGRFVDAVVDILADLMEGIGSYAYDIGVGLGRFVNAVVGTLADLMEGLKSHAKEIGEKISYFMLKVADTVASVASILSSIVGIIADFFEGLRTHAKAIGEKISEIILVTADIMLEAVKLIRSIVKNIIKNIQLYIIAPFKALRTKIQDFAILVADCRWPLGGIGEAILGHKPTDDEIERAKQGNSINDYIKAETDALNKKFEEEDKAAALVELNKKMEQKKIEQMLNSIHIIDDMFSLIKEIHKYIFKDKEPITIETSIQIVKPGLDSINNIENQSKENQNSLAENLNNRNEILKNNKNKNNAEQIDNFGPNLLSYLDEKFKMIFEKLDNQSMIPIPIQILKNNKDFVRKDNI